MCRRLTDDALKALRTLPCLLKLSLSCCVGITDTGACHLFDRRRSPALATLVSLNLSQTGITDAALRILARSRALNLRELVVSHCAGITIEGLQLVMAALPSCDLHNHHGFSGH